MISITRLFLKKSKGEAMLPLQSLSVVKGLGIKGDVNASAISPRQILITRQEDLDELNIPYGGLRENVIISGLNPEAFQPGSVLCLGNNVRIRLTFHCEPCKRIIDVVPSLVAVLHKRGILGVVLESGSFSVGESVSCQPNQYDPFSEVPYERFLNFVQYIPPGKVVTYKMVTQGMGVAESYIRAMPKYVEKALLESLKVPIHRIVDVSGATIHEYVPNQLQLLKGENIDVVSTPSLFSAPSDYTVPLSKYLWSGSSLYLS